MQLRLRRPEHPGRVAIVTGGALLALNLAIWGALAQDTSTGEENRPGAIEQLFPGENAQARPQETIGADLDDALGGVLYFDGVRIPEDQYVGDVSLGQVVFRPGEGTEYVEFPDGPHTVTVEFWNRTRTEAEARDSGGLSSYSWQITVN